MLQDSLVLFWFYRSLNTRIGYDMNLSWAEAKNYIVTGFIGLWFIFVTKDVIESPSTHDVKELLKQHTVVSVNKDEILAFVDKYSRFNTEKLQIDTKLIQIDYMIETFEKRQGELLVQIQENRTENAKQVESIRSEIRQNSKDLQALSSELMRTMTMLDAIRNSNHKR